MNAPDTIWNAFEQIATAFPRHIAVEDSRLSLTYSELYRLSARVAAALPSLGAVAIIPSSDPESYAGLLAALASGGTPYLPIHRALPEPRLAEVLEKAEASALLLSPSVLPHAIPLLRHSLRPLRVVYNGISEEDIRALSRNFPRHIFRSIPPDPQSIAGCTADDRSAAYVLFTSGSTGAPKAVPITRANLRSYLSSIRSIAPLHPGDRVSQANDWSFDLSIHDMLAAWTSGSCLVRVPDRYRALPLRFIQEQGLTVWFSTTHPVAMNFALEGHRYQFPFLRLVMHAGEPFSIELAKQWQRAAPSARILNLYGPAEATIVISHFEWNGESIEHPTGNLPIGRIFSNHRWRILPGIENEPDLAGELLLTGPQVFPGYLDGEDSSFEEDENGDRWYRTGDLVSVSSSCDLVFQGRRDSLVKLRGYRVSLLEVEAALRSASGANMVLVFPRPPGSFAASELIGVIPDLGPPSEEEIFARLRERIPVYMMPSRIVRLDSLPKLPSGKLDRSRAIDMTQRMLNVDGTSARGDED